jgi:hypothetical protein
MKRRRLFPYDSALLPFFRKGCILSFHGSALRFSIVSTVFRARCELWENNPEFP